MAETKKTATVKPTAKAVAAKAADTKTAEVKAAPVEPVAKAEPIAEKKTAAKKTTAKKAVEKKTPGRKPAAKKAEEAKKVTVTEESAVKTTLHIQFAGKAYTTEDLVKIAKDVWKYDLGNNEDDFKNVELYVKPEEHVVYYVINGDVNGSFGI